MTTTNEQPPEANGPNEEAVAKTDKKKGFLHTHLEPIDRLSEMIYGVLIVMTFTMSFAGIDTSTLSEGMLASEAIQRLFLAAIGCVVAWGMIDAVMYILTSVFERADHQRVVRAIHQATNENDAVSVLSDALDNSLTESMTEEERDKLYRVLYHRFQNKPIERAGIERDDVFGACAVFVIAVAATLPVALPYLFIGDPFWALRLSNLIALIMLFWAGYRWAKYAGANPWKIGGFLALFGLVIVLIAIPLGG